MATAFIFNIFLLGVPETQISRGCGKRKSGQQDGVGGRNS